MELCIPVLESQRPVQGVVSSFSPAFMHAFTHTTQLFIVQLHAGHPRQGKKDTVPGLLKVTYILEGEV